MRYIIKNLRSSLTKNPAVSWLYILCTVVSVLAVLFSHGVYQNYETKIVSTDDDSFDPLLPNIDIYFGNVTQVYTAKNGNKLYFGDGTSTVGEFREMLSKLDNETKEGIGGFFLWYNTYQFETPKEYSVATKETDPPEKYTFGSRLIYDKSSCDYGLNKTYINNIPIREGRNLTQQEELNGTQVIVLPPDYNDSLIGTSISFMDKEYTVIGIEDKNSRVKEYIVPFKTLSDDLEFSFISLTPDKPITTKVYKRFVAVMEEVYGDRVLLPDFPTVDEEEQTFYRSIMLISLVLSAIAAITLAILFRFIIYTRRKSLAVLRLSGCTRNGARLMYITEGIGITAALFLLTTLAYNKWILPHLTVFFDRITEVYTPTTYVYIAAVFLGTLFVVLCAMVSFSVDKQPVDMLRKAGGR